MENKMKRILILFFIGFALIGCEEAKWKKKNYLGTVESFQGVANDGVSFGQVETSEGHFLKVDDSFTPLKKGDDVYLWKKGNSCGSSRKICSEGGRRCSKLARGAGKNL